MATAAEEIDWNESLIKTPRRKHRDGSPEQFATPGLTSSPIPPSVKTISTPGFEEFEAMSVPRKYYRFAEAEIGGVAEPAFLAKRARELYWYNLQNPLSKVHLDPVSKRLFCDEFPADPTQERLVDFEEYLKEEGKNLSVIEEDWTEEGVRAAVERIRGFYPPLAEDIDNKLDFPGFNFLADDMKAKVFEYMNRSDQECAKIDFGPELLRAFTHLYQISKDIADELAYYFEQGINYDGLPDHCKSMLLGQIGFDTFYDSQFSLDCWPPPLASGIISGDPTLPILNLSSHCERALDLMLEEKPAIGQFIDVLFDKGISPDHLPGYLKAKFDEYLQRVPRTADEQSIAAAEESIAGEGIAEEGIAEEGVVLPPVIVPVGDEEVIVLPSLPDPAVPEEINLPINFTDLEERALAILYQERPAIARTIHNFFNIGCPPERLPVYVKHIFECALRKASEGAGPSTLAASSLVTGAGCRVKKIKSITILNRLRFWKKKKRNE